VGLFSALAAYIASARPMATSTPIINAEEFA
jgi:hypothetical protein